MLSEIVAQTEKAARLLEKSQRTTEKVRGLRSGDRVYTPLVTSAIFSQGAAPSQNVVFNVPADADFWAYRLLLFPYCRIVDPVNGTPDEVTFRSTSFSGEAGSTGVVDPDLRYTDFNSMLDGTFALIYQGKELQNIDTPMSAAYCANEGKWMVPTNMQSSTNRWTAASQTPGGYVFDIPMFLPRTKSLVCRLTPTYLGIRTISENVIIDDEPTTIVRQHQYKIVAVLEGEKKVSAFR